MTGIAELRVPARKRRHLWGIGFGGVEA